MKKHLIAAAVAAAVAVPAAAQVTVSGRLDVSFTSQSKAGTNADNAISQRAVRSALMATPFIRFSGSEDLGGGLKAGFYVETTIVNDTPAATSLGDRGSMVSLAGGFGTIRLGKMDTSNNNAIQAGYTNVNNFDLDTAHGGNNRPENAIAYTSPRFNGFSVNAMYSTRATGAELYNSITENKQGRMLDYGITYANGPIAAMVYTGETDVDVAAAASDGKQEQTGMMASYDFGVARAQVRYLKQEPSGGVAVYDSRSTALDLAVPLGNGFTVIGGYRTEENKEVLNSGFDVTSIFLVKDLSKRTSLYAAVAKASNEAAATAALGATPAGSDPQAYAFGVRHTF